MSRYPLYYCGELVIVDSAMSQKVALRDNPKFPCPVAIRTKLRLVEVLYWSHDGRVHAGQLVVHRDIECAVRGIFRELLEEEYRIHQVVPIVAYGWDDERSMQANNTSGFNYRKKATKDELSNHSFGRAIDLEPWFNPCIIGGRVQPVGARYDPTLPGTLTPESLPVRLFKARGADWGGEWETIFDPQHFEFP